MQHEVFFCKKWVALKRAVVDCNSFYTAEAFKKKVPKNAGIF